MMFANPGSLPEFGHRLTRDVAERIAANWWRLLLNGALLIVAGVLIWSIDWTVRELATFIGALFIFEGLSMALTSGIGPSVTRSNVVTGLLSVAAGVVIIAWPEPGITALAIVLGAWLIVVGSITITGAFAVRPFMRDWWVLLITGLLEVPLGILALADPNSTLAAIITVGGIWAVAIGVMRIVLAFQLKHLPQDVDEAFGAGSSSTNGVTTTPQSQTPTPA
jgi:uncharacterized membrane protein HdeD (DUF308 family)